jgi:iron complex outermembrane receptor protein
MRRTRGAGTMAVGNRYRLYQRRLALGIAAAACSVTAVAQAADTPELVTVTARKRSETLQRVDISMDVISADSMRRLNLNYLPQLAEMSENVALFEDMPGAGIPTWVIRGVGLQDFNTNNTPTAGVFLDGAYQVSTAMGGAALFDVEQVEILKGPQGGLYGRNTSGGAVLLNTRRAQTDLREGYVELGHGSWNRVTFAGAYNQPVSEQLAFRVAARAEQGDDGWQRSVADNSVHGATDRWDLRSWLRYEPADALTVELKLQAGRDGSDVVLGRAIGLYAPSAPLAFCPSLRAGHRDDSCLSFAGLTQRLTAGGARDNVAAQAEDGSRVLSDPLNALDSDYAGSVLDLQWVLPGFTLASISTWDRFDYGVNLDLDGSTGEFAHRFSYSDIEVFSQELRIAAPANARLQWLAGVNYSHENFSERRDFNLRDSVLVGLGQGKLSYEQGTDALAFFLDAAYALNEQWQLNATLRHTDEEKDYRDGNFWQLRATPFYFVRNISADYSLDKPWSGSIGLSWTPETNTLGYVKYSQGFKSGGFYGGLPFSATAITPYREETIAAWELGLRQYWPEARLTLEGAVFAYDYEDVQGFIRELNPLTGSAVDRLGNQGDARHHGAELDLKWQPGRWNVGAGLGWLDAEYRKSGVLTVGTDGSTVEIQGDRPWAPRWSANLQLGYRQELDAGTLDFGAGWNWRSDFSGHHYSLLDSAVNHLPGYALLNASATLSSTGGLWKGQFWMRNVMDKSYRTRVKADGLNSYIDVFGEPRSFGVTLTRQL